MYTGNGASGKHLAMTIETEIIERAIRRVERERSLLSTEQCRFRTFRTAVSRATADEDDTPSGTAADLVDTYRETVMETPDFETAYDETLKESLEEELSPSLAEILLSNAPLTQKRKRDLLIATNAAIERRERFRSELDQEQESLETMLSELIDIRSEIRELPECSSRRHTVEDVLDIWKAYDTLEQRCNDLLEERQQHIYRVGQDTEGDESKYILNEYLYHDLETPYPVLSAIAAACETIDSRKSGSRFDFTASVA